MKNTQTYRIEHPEDILDSKNILVKHHVYGKNVWTNVPYNKPFRCAVLRQFIFASGPCFQSNNISPYKDDKISLLGMKKLIQQMRLKTRRALKKIALKKKSEQL